MSTETVSRAIDELIERGGKRHERVAHLREVMNELDRLRAVEARAKDWAAADGLAAGNGDVLYAARNILDGTT